VQELVPLGLGFLLGTGLGLLRPSLRVPVGAALAIVFGTLATTLTGEAEVSWAFVLIDVPTVTVAAALGLAAGRQLSTAPRHMAG
jgi:hypothetical protein